MSTEEERHIAELEQRIALLELAIEEYRKYTGGGPNTAVVTSVDRKVALGYKEDTYGGNVVSLTRGA